jgi:diguanylate cyclase (GGDEF)-like protein
VREILMSDARLRSGALTVWLVLSAALTAAATDGAGQIAAVMTLLAVALAGQLLGGTWKPFAAGVVGGMVLPIVTVGGPADPMFGGLAALVTTLTGLVSSLCRSDLLAASLPVDTLNRHAAPTPAGIRLPAGVADEALLDRLAVHEMTRARRYEHPLTLLLVGVDGWSTLSAERGKRAAFEVLSTLAMRIRRLLRDVDAIGLHGDGRLAVILPETPLDGAIVVASRIEQAAREDVGLKTRVGVSIFPDDAVTVEALIREAEAALDLARLEDVTVVERVRLV